MAYRIKNVERVTQPGQKLLTKPEVARILGVSESAVDKLAASGVLRRIKLLGRTRYNAAEVDHLCQCGTEQAA